MKNEKIIEYRGKIPDLLNKEDGKIIYICSSNKNLEDYYNLLIDMYDGKVIKIEGFFENEETDKINYEILNILKNEKKYIILTSLEGFLRDYYPKGEIVKFEVNKSKDITQLIETLVNNNYKKQYMVEKRKEYSHRGDILDIFFINGEYPVRIEFFDNIVDRITYFNIDSQKSIEKFEQLDMYITNNKESVMSFLDFISIDNDNNKKLYFENIEILSYKIEEIILRKRERENIFRKRFLDLYESAQEIEIKTFTNEEISKYEDLLELKQMSEHKKITLYTEEEKRYKELLKGTNIKIEKSFYFEGFKEIHNKTEHLFLTDRELKGIKIIKRRVEDRKLRYNDVSEIRENDYIIHRDFGVGIYQGIQIIEGRDYLKIQYAGEDKLFVPIENIKNIEKYVCTPGSVPEIYKLGRKGFKRKKEKLQEEIEKFAHEIIEIQARREKEIGFIFSQDTVWQEEFEEGFPYKETPSQMKAIEDVKKDMETGKIMDRVICGDVGYGKTEVALRASFKATIDSKQVAVLVPTTVLAEQHYERFSERFKNYPIKIESMSRLKSQKEQKEILNKLKIGTVDVLIGTHRILSDDLKFKDLGLLIIDEEQKFGVKAKEKLKKLKNKVSVLTLTATPIPRTLNLSLLGIRDLSIIDTPPEGRKPIDTMFIENNNDQIRNAIMNEISREGQVYYIYNSVKQMEWKLKELQKILPNYIKIDYIHGQMSPRDIKNKIIAFENEQIDVLIATTIIENGIDIENANTMIIDGFEKLGLSQMYQLRGRIGRGDKKAYCYLIKNYTKSKKAIEREQTMRDLQSDNNGLKLSMEDMRIRGAGEILGDRQHGALETFGYNMYVKMLKEEMDKIKGIIIKEKNSDEEELIIELDSYGFIPDKYIARDEKIKIYKRLVEIQNEKELRELRDEVADRFGKIPNPVLEVFNYVWIKLNAIKNHIIKIRERKNNKKNKNEYLIIFNKEKLNERQRENLFNIIARNEADYDKIEEGIIYKRSLKEFFINMS
ncbi:DEAD/DEAH box helicase [Fusobacterium sp. PH5-44]|uniref:DEAD/DEAH box helicase n=1 Tax=unclassified Fusobacterium TaxID=2648384 RepID=UPI003D1AB2D7